ncbi:MAG: Lrp/AsnC ligand binding domain-containing protein [Candidatus Bathyarchaeota archaeon]|nr:Lrp/AsnC ligand binding domain-containing protein [Candidatus Bathyarchaeota archaeon]
MTNLCLQPSLNKAETPKAYVLINVAQGSENQVIKAAKALVSLKKAHNCFGIYNLILKIEPDSLDNLKELIAHKYRTIKGIQSILVLIINRVISEENFPADKKY